MGTTKPVDT